MLAGVARPFFGLPTIPPNADWISDCLSTLQGLGAAATAGPAATPSIATTSAVNPAITPRRRRFELVMLPLPSRCPAAPRGVNLDPRARTPGPLRARRSL